MVKTEHIFTEASPGFLESRFRCIKRFDLLFHLIFLKYPIKNEITWSQSGVKANRFDPPLI